MKYVAEIDGRALNFALEETDGGFRATFDGATYNIRVDSPEPGVYLIYDGIAVHEAVVSQGARGMVRVNLRGRTVEARVIDRKHRGHLAEHSSEGRQTLVAPMPGKVVRILRQTGEEVTAGQGVLVVEAMKMQNEIKSPKSGRVIDIRVAEGDAVEANKVVAVVE